MLYMNIWLTVKNVSDVQKVRALLSQHGRLSKAEPGCRRFEVYHSKNDATRFLICEHWASQAELDEHRKAEGYTTIYQPQVLPLVDREPHPSNLVE